MKLTTRVISTILNSKPVSKRLAKILHLIPRRLIWDYLGVECASPFARFVWDGYDDLLYENYNLSVDDCVLVLGGYFGGSTQIWREKYQVSVIVAEPVPD